MNLYCLTVSESLLVGKAFVSDGASRHGYALPDDYITDKSLSRSSKDTKLNSSSIFLIDFCRQTGMRIANGRLVPMLVSGSEQWCQFNRLCLSI